jgi:Zn-dependent peptidase ImmA (M78 family)/DNA-binding XRE family transcriptional regulator
MEGDILDKLDPRELGRELQNARSRRGITQAEAAKLINAARTTITAIENGKRAVKPSELIRLARAYGRQVSDFVRVRPHIEPFQPQFRGPYKASEEEKKEINAWIMKLEDLARNYVEIEQITDSPLRYKYPEEYKIGDLSIDVAAETIANSERHRLALGDGPVPILRDILEREVGLRIFYLPLSPWKFSAIYLYDHQLGGCIAVNSNHPEDRRRWSIAHDYGHFLAHRYKQNLHFQQTYTRVPLDEQFADAFAIYFLMPTSGLTRQVNEIYNKDKFITPANLCILANYYGVSFETLTLHLEDLRLIPTGIYGKLKERGFQVREAQRKLGLSEIPSSNEMLPVRYQYLALEAYEEGLISEGQLARFLDVDRLEARTLAGKLSLPDEDTLFENIDQGTGSSSDRRSGSNV